jgi:hypothetical protein
MDARTNNTFACAIKQGTQKKDPSKTWKGVLVNVTIDGVIYGGLIFPVRGTSIPKDQQVQF